jgi:hypothetical protein
MEYSRLGIVISLIGIPVYLLSLLWILYSNGVRFDIPNETLSVLTQFVTAPLFFSIPWLLFIYLNRERISDSVKHMAETSTIIPIRWRVFYGFTTLIVILALIVPFASPILAVAGGVVLAGRTYFSIESMKQKRRRVKALTVLLLLVFFAGLPTLLLIYFISSYSSLFSKVWGIWGENVGYVYLFSLCIGDALAVGSLLWLIYAGAAEFEFQTYGTYTTRPPAKFIRVLEIAVFAAILYFGRPFPPISGISLGPDKDLIGRVNLVCLVIVGIVFLISTFKGLRRPGSGRSSVWGLIFLIGFLAIELYWHYINYSETSIAPTVAVFGATILFLMMFFIGFLKVRQR